MKLRRYPGFWDPRYRVGAWAFLLHRITGVIIALYGIAHVLVIGTALRGGESFDRIMERLHQPWVLALELLLIAAILYHILNGFRLSLFDLGLGVTRQKAIFWWLMALGAAIMGVTVAITLPYL